LISFCLHQLLNLRNFIIFFKLCFNNANNPLCFLNWINIALIFLLRFLTACLIITILFICEYLEGHIIYTVVCLQIMDVNLFLLFLVYSLFFLLVFILIIIYDFLIFIFILVKLVYYFINTLVNVDFIILIYLLYIILLF